MSAPDGGILAAVEASVRERFAGEPARASVAFLGVEPIEVLRFADGARRSYLTLGMSRLPMTAAAEAHLAEDGPRAELLLELDDPDERCGVVWRRLAVLAAAPAVEGVVYRDGMTVDLGEALVPGSACTGAMVIVSALPAVAAAATPEHLGRQPDRPALVDILQVLPATANELAWSRVHGSGALRERWAHAGTPLADLARRPVALS